MLTQRSPEEVDDSLEVSRDQHQQGDDSGEDQCWGWSQSVDVSHGQNVWLWNEHNSVKKILNYTV